MGGITMNFKLTEDHEAIIADVRAFAKKDFQRK